MLCKPIPQFIPNIVLTPRFCRKTTSNSVSLSLTSSTLLRSFEILHKSHIHNGPFQAIQVYTRRKSQWKLLKQRYFVTASPEERDTENWETSSLDGTFTVDAKDEMSQKEEPSSQASGDELIRTTQSFIAPAQEQQLTET